MSRIVVSLGGNALGKNPEEQKQLLKTVASSIVNLIQEDNEVVIAHGNGPQVGMINLAFSESKSTPNMPFPECGAMSQGYIGFHLQNAIGNELARLNIDRTVASVVTQVIVDQNDPAFQNPTKPIGSFYTKEESLKLEQENGFDMVELCVDSDELEDDRSVTLWEAAERFCENIGVVFSQVIESDLW